jgi:hypothetical protein
MNRDESTSDSRANLLALAERVEALAEPDREVDAQVGRYFAAQYLGYVPWEPQTGCAKFTDSLDAAMSLVPSGWQWTVSLSLGRVNIAIVTVLHDDSLVAPLEYEATAPTPALALTAAALRALAAQQPSGAENVGQNGTTLTGE